MNWPELGGSRLLSGTGIGDQNILAGAPISSAHLNSIHGYLDTGTEMANQQTDGDNGSLRTGPDFGFEAEVEAALAAGDTSSALVQFRKLHPSDQGDLLGELNPELRRMLMKALAPQEAADVLEKLDPEVAVEFSEDLPTGTLADVLDEASPDVAADILRGLPDKLSEPALEAMESSDAVEELLEYGDDTAGGHMTNRYVAVSKDSTIGKALDHLRLAEPDLADAGTVFVTEPEGRLAGSIGVAELALGRPAYEVGAAMNEQVYSVGVDTDQEECARVMSRYDLDRLPVVDNFGRLVGVIRDYDLVDVVVEEATEDIYRLAGLGNEHVFGPLRRSVKHRLPWIYINLGTVLVAAAVIGVFESTISRFAILAAFFPVVMGQGGMSGVQTLTLVVRAITLGDVEPRHLYMLLVREAALGVLHGTAVGVALGVLLALWKGNVALGVVIGVATLTTMVIGGVVGAAVPLTLRRFGVDPALASAAVVTTATDVFGALVSLGMAAALIEWLV